MVIEKCNPYSKLRGSSNVAENLNVAEALPALCIELNLLKQVHLSEETVKNKWKMIPIGI